MRHVVPPPQIVQQTDDHEQVTEERSEDRRAHDGVEAFHVENVRRPRHHKATGCQCYTADHVERNPKTPGVGIVQVRDVTQAEEKASDGQADRSRPERHDEGEGEDALGGNARNVYAQPGRQALAERLARARRVGVQFALEPCAHADDDHQRHADAQKEHVREDRHITKHEEQIYEGVVDPRVHDHTDDDNRDQCREGNQYALDERACHEPTDQLVVAIKE